MKDITYRRNPDCMVLATCSVTLLALNNTEINLKDVELIMS